MEGETIIYADVLFLINFIIDFLCLFVTAKLLSLRTHILRFACSAVCGGIYSCAAIYLSEMHAIVRISIHVAAAFFLCIVAFGFLGIIKSFFVFVCSAAFLGGILMAFYSLANKYAYLDGGFYAEINPFTLIFLALLPVVGVFVYFLLCKNKLKSSSRIITFTHEGHKYRLELLVDSGCFVRDPISGDSVVIVSAQALLPYININGAEPEDLKKLGKGARLVPISTASGSKLLAGFRPKDAQIFRFGEQKRKNIQIIVAVDCIGGLFGGYDGLIAYETV